MRSRNGLRSGVCPMAPVASVTSSVAIVDPGPDPRHVEEPVTQLAGSGGVAVTSEGGLMRCLYRDISPTVADWTRRAGAQRGAGRRS